MATKHNLPDQIEVAHPEAQLNMLRVSDAAATRRLMRREAKHLQPFFPITGHYNRLTAAIEHRYIAAQMRFGQGAFYKLTNPESNEDYGRIGLLGAGGDRAEMIYWLAETYQGRGIATAAATAVRDLGFTTLRLEAVELRILPENLSSKGVAENIGASFKEMISSRIEKAHELWEVHRDAF